MKKAIISITLLCFTYNMHAQSIQRSVIATAGTTSTTGTLVLSSTVGESFINKLSSADNSITQGFHQPNIVVSRISEDEIENESETVLGNKELLSPNGVLSLSIFPNPVTDFVNISSETNDELQIALLDASGKLIQQLKHQSSTQIDFTNYVAGTYYLVATTEDGKTRNTFKVIKQR